MNNQGFSESQFNQSAKTSNLSQSTSNTPLAEQSNSPPSEKRKRLRLWLLLVLLGSSMFLRAPYQVGGDVKLDTLPDRRKSILNPQQVPCKIEKVTVKVGDLVKEGDELVQLSCRLLDEDIQKIRLELENANQELEALDKQSGIALSSARNEYAKSQSAFAAAARSANVEESGLQSEIISLETRKNTFQSEKNAIDEKINKIRPAVKESAISQETLNNAEKESTKLGNQIKEIEAQIQVIRYQFQKSAQIEQSRSDLQAIAANESSAIAEISSQSLAIKEKIKNRTARLQALTTQQTNLILRSPILGKVYAMETSSEFDNLEGKEIQSGLPIMLIADTKQLVAKIEIDRKDRELVEKDSDVKFRSDSAKEKAYEGKISRRDPKYTTSTSPSQPPKVEVSFVVENSDGNLLIGEIGHAQISTKDMFIFERIGWEISRLIPTKFRG